MSDSKAPMRDYVYVQEAVSNDLRTLADELDREEGPRRESVADDLRRLADLNDPDDPPWPLPVGETGPSVLESDRHSDAWVDYSPPDDSSYVTAEEYGPPDPSFWSWLRGLF